jgi:hypothetical protein
MILLPSTTMNLINSKKEPIQYYSVAQTRGGGGVHGLFREDFLSRMMKSTPTTTYNILWWYDVLGRPRSRPRAVAKGLVFARCKGK